MSDYSFIIQISDKDDNPLTQISRPKQLVIDEKLNKTYTSSFFMDFKDVNSTKEIIRQFNRVDIFEAFGGIETKVFEGVIRGYESNLQGTTIQMVDFKYLLSKRILFSSDYIAINEDADVTLTNLLAQINGLDDTGITLDTVDVLTTQVNKEYKRGENILDIIEDLAVATQAEFIVKDRKLQFKSTIGVDRSIIGPDFRDFRFDIANPNENSITQADINNDSDKFANGILGKSGVNFDGQTDLTSIGVYGRIESTENFAQSSPAGLTDQVTEFLDLSKVEKKFPDIRPSTNGLLYQSVNVGDIVPVFINVGSELFSVDENIKIVRKRLTSSEFNVPAINLEFSENALSDTNLIEDITNLQSQVKQLELNT